MSIYFISFLELHWAGWEWNHLWPWKKTCWHQEQTCLFGKQNCHLVIQLCSCKIVVKMGSNFSRISCGCVVMKFVSFCFSCRWIMHLSHQQTWGLITACSSGTFVCLRFSKSTKRSSMQTVLSMRTVLRYFWIDYNLFSFIFLQSTLFKTDIYKAGTNCLSKGAFHCENWLARPNSCHSDKWGADGGGNVKMSGTTFKDMVTLLNVSFVISSPRCGVSGLWKSWKVTLSRLKSSNHLETCKRSSGTLRKRKLWTRG